MPKRPNSKFGSKTGQQSQVSSDEPGSPVSPAVKVKFEPEDAPSPEKKLTRTDQSTVSRNHHQDHLNQPLKEEQPSFMRLKNFDVTKIGSAKDLRKQRYLSENKKAV